MEQKLLNLAINPSDMLAPDDKTILWEFKSLYGIRQERVAEINLVLDFITVDKNKNFRCLFMLEPE